LPAGAGVTGVAGTNQEQEVQTHAVLKAGAHVVTLQVTHVLGIEVNDVGVTTIVSS
jgi:hypothetical protein